ncbi:cadmium-translocating P-type ATPase [Bombilactobacillus folatiphilus]|uniref:Cd(2+)-exporting ATPase n=1 Tax=Bombilactobacillus folatiphilus TaxID=2923362 RepID=A0ABY4P8Q3_9LACO|nr:heavy metal translocating P-type ATPase [Bombilactobacillus folatiphilus]UQS82093.1 cadmium-translocating P-type ATPase [Bombilactobacillus folatiphilus]
MHYKKLLIIFLIALVAFALQFVFHLNAWAQILITIVGILLAVSMTLEMIKTLRSGKYGVDLLAILAIVSTLAVGQYWASLIILLMLVGGDTLEDYAANRAGSELKALLENAPEQAHIMHDGQIQDLALDDVQVNDQLLIKPGEQVPVDGVVTSGNGDFDESSLTGESKPVEKNVGDSLMSGSINGNTAVEYRATKLAVDSQYQKIIRLVEESQQQPAHFVRLADRYAVPFTIIALIISGIAWIITGDPNRFAQVLVVASPCPLILAAPIALVSGMSRTSRNGIIVKSGTSIEKMALLKEIFFDKTGTITRGQLSLDQVLPESGWTQDQLIQTAASVEQQSNHILATSLLHSYHQQLQQVTQLKEVTAQGVQGYLNQKLVKAGKFSFVAPDLPPQNSDQPTIYISIDRQYAGKITFTDQIRPEAKQTITQLSKLGIKHLRMLTGDNKATALSVAQEVQIPEVDANLLPEDKIKILQNAPQNQRPNAMVGDGVNDAPSLAVADVGIAMGANGSTAASEAADVVIIKDDLSRLIRGLVISRETMTIAKQSVLIGIFICIALMLVAALGLIPTIIGALLQEVIDTISILWALKARHGKTNFN